MTVAELLQKHGIALNKDTKPGRYYTTCPKCSKDRQKPGHKAARCLGVNIERDGANWGCNHCLWTGPEKGRGEPRGNNELVSYDYVDPDGALLFQKVRNPPGRKPPFWCRRPNGRGGWINNTKGIDNKPLYRWPQIAAAMAEDREIAIVEGEKHADNLWRLGIPATCNFDGTSDVIKNPKAKQKWKAEYSEALRGARIVVFNDNDPPGYAHADNICKLSLDVAKRVRRLDLKIDWPEIPKGGDVSDWLAASGEHTPEKLKALIAAAPDFVGAGDPAPGPAPPDDDVEIERLAKLSMFEYERERKVAAEKFDVRASILDKLVAAKRSELGLDIKEDGKQGRPMRYDEPEPWPEPVEGAQLLDDLAAAARRFLVLPEHGDTIAALWPVHSYLLDIASVSPRLQISAPDSECGKSTFLDVMHAVVRRAQNAVNLTPAVTFRLMDRFQPTILLDEADATLPENEDLRSVLDSGHHPRGEVPRLVGEELEPRVFKTYGAFAFALIGRLTGKLKTLDSRSIVVRLERKRADQIVEGFDVNSPAELAPLKRRIVRFVEDNRAAIGAARVSSSLSNRRADNWRILLQIAAVAGGDWPERARKAAGSPEELVQSQLEELLSDIGAIFATSGDVVIDKGDKFISSTKLAEALAAIDGHSWAEYGRSRKPLTSNKLAKLLSRVKIAPDQNSDCSARGYHLGQFDEAFKTYASPSPGNSKCLSVGNAGNSGTSRNSKVSEAPPASDTSETTTNADAIGVSDTSTLRKGGNGPLGLSTREIDALAERYGDDFHDRRDEPNVEHKLDEELRQRLRMLGVLPEHVGTEFRRVKDTVFRVADARTRREFEDMPFDGDDA